MTKEVMSLQQAIEDKLKQFTNDVYLFPCKGPDNPADLSYLAEKRVPLMVSTLVHGDEPIGLWVLEYFLSLHERNQLTVPIPLTFTIGNRAAALAGKRFLEYDLNRLFGHNPKDLTRAEDQVAERLEKALQDSQAEILLDIHQSRMESLGHFVVCVDTPINYAFARSMDPQMAVILLPPPVRSKKELAAGIPFCEYSLNHGFKAGLTLELGHRLDVSPEMVMKGVEIVERAMTFAKDTTIAVEKWQTRRSYDKNLYRWSDFSYQKAIAELRPGIRNLEPVRAGEIIGKTISDNVPLNSPVDGVIIFPQYDKGAKQDQALCIFCEKIEPESMMVDIKNGQ